MMEKESIKFVDLNAYHQEIKVELDEIWNSILQEGSFIGGSNNSYVTKFEEDFAKYIGANHCVSCANGTDALEVALLTLGIGAGDKVIVPAISWASTAEAVMNVGATPVFVDVKYDDCLINENLIAEKLDDKVKAIIPVHLYGKPVNLEAIKKICSENNLFLIEDCAQAHGAEFNGQRVGTFGDVACFSFYPGKNLGALGDAGAMIFQNAEYAEIARQICNHGQIEKHNHLRVGRNSRLDGLQAAVLSLKINKLDEHIDKRIQWAKEYNQLLEGIEEVKTPSLDENLRHVFHLYVVRTEKRGDLIKKLKANNIPYGIHYPKTLPSIKPFNASGIYPVADKVCEEILSLPMHPYLNINQLNIIAQILAN